MTEKFAEYLTGSHVEIYMDNNPLAYLGMAKLDGLFGLILQCHLVQAQQQ